MKKKLLTVLLAVVMVFGVFGLTACSGSNADENYNYYAVKYDIEGDIAIDAVTFQGVYKMFSDAGKFLLYVDTETSANTKDNMQKINKLALDWGVTIYHFNPDLSGGYAKDDENAVNANIISELTGDAAVSLVGTVVQPLLLAASNTELSDWADCTLVAVQGKDSVVSSTLTVEYRGEVVASNPVSAAEKSITAIATKRPSYGAYTDKAKDVPAIPEAYLTGDIDTINCFADARLHMYDEVGDLTADKEDVFVTVANYAMFAHLMDNNEGYFSVFFGGTWCPNTQAIAKLTNDLAKDYGINKIYFFDPNLSDFPMFDVVGTQENEDGILVPVIIENNDPMWTLYGLNTRSDDSAGCVYNFLYANFVDAYLPTYWSEWNVESKLSINGKDYTKMCVPNIMLFNGEEEDKPATLVKFAEAEYSWSEVSVEGTDQNIGWTEAVKAVFDENPYATYAPILVAEETEDSAADSAASSSSSTTTEESGGMC